MRTHFTKQPNGGWRFETSRGETFEAWRNEAGFAGRQWTLSKIDWYGVADGRYNEMTTIVRDDIESRAACVAEAEWLGKSADEFWAQINAIWNRVEDDATPETSLMSESRALLRPEE